MKEELLRPTLGTLQGDSSQILFRCISGSRAYGTHRPESDTDVKGIYMLPSIAYLRMEEPISQMSDERGDTVYYSLKRFMELAANANPNIIELLFMPNGCILLQTELMHRLLEQRHLFVTKKAYESHVGYAHAQIKKARGRNKWVNNPQPNVRPNRESFCWIIPPSYSGGGFPFRPVPLSDSGIDLSQCDCASLEHVPDVYRIYRLDSRARGVFRGGDPVCNSIAKEDEQHCVGLLIYNRRAYEQALNDHRNYWNWRKNRNDARWQKQECGEMDYDAKNMMHTFRLLYSGQHILKHNEPLIRFEGEQLGFLKSILAGQYEYDELMELADNLIGDLHDLFMQSDLPEGPDMDAINNLMIELTLEWEANLE